MTRLKTSFILFVTIFLTSCRKPADHAGGLDSEVEISLVNSTRWVDAIIHLDKGGHFIETGIPEDEEIDRTHLLPLLKQLATKLKIQWKIVVDRSDPGYGVTLLARIPETEGFRRSFEAQIEAAQPEFPKRIIPQWGHHWLLLEFSSREKPHE